MYYTLFTAHHTQKESRLASIWIWFWSLFLLLLLLLLVKWWDWHMSEAKIVFVMSHVFHQFKALFIEIYTVLIHCTIRFFCIFVGCFDKNYICKLLPYEIHRNDNNFFCFSIVYVLLVDWSQLINNLSRFSLQKE